MVKSGDNVSLVDGSHGLSEVPEKAGDESLLHGGQIGRGPSIVSQGDEVMLLDEIFAQGRAEGAGVIYYCDFRGSGAGVYKLDKETFDVLESFDTAWEPHGIGGDADVVWVGDEDNRVKIYKREPTRLRKVSEGTLPVGQSEMGGSADVVYVCLHDADQLARLDPKTFAVQQQVAAPGGRVNGIGGDVSVVWNCSPTVIQELDPDDLSTVIRSNDVSASLGQSGAGGSLVGIGGSSTSIFAVENHGSGTGNIHSVDPDTLSIDSSKSVDFGTGKPSGVGGF